MEHPAPLTITLEPLDDHLIVEPVDEDVETRTGLIIPQSAEAGCRSGIVTAVGARSPGHRPRRQGALPQGRRLRRQAGWGGCKVLSRRELIARVHD